MLLWIGWWLGISSVLAQIPNTLPSSVPQSQQAPTVEEPRDTVPLTYILPLSAETIRPGEDTLPDFNFRMYDPAREQLFDWGTLGVVGSAARPLWYEPREAMGFHTGIRPFELYRLRPDSLRFYQSRRTYTQVLFSRGLRQNDDLVRARLSRTFAKGLILALDWKSFQNVGQFRSQSGKHTALSVGVMYAVSKRYDFSAVMTVNADAQTESGGIQHDSLLRDPVLATTGPIEVPVRLRENHNNSRLTDRSLLFTHHLTYGQADRRALRFTHTVHARSEVFKFGTRFSTPSLTEAEAKDTAFFRQFLTDLRGLRHYVTLQQIRNEVSAQALARRKNNQTPNLLTAGLMHTWFRLRDGRGDSTVNNLFATGSLILSPTRAFAWRTTGALGLLANFGEYNLHSNLRIDLGHAGLLEATLQSRRTPAPLVAHQVWITGQQVWSHDWAKMVESNLTAVYSLPKVGLRLIGGTHLLNNYIYFDQKSLPQQTAAPVQIAQLALEARLHWRGIHLDNTIGVQRVNQSAFLRLPNWFTKHSLYYEGHIFKKNLFGNLGVDFRANAPFQADAYQPIVWQFSLQDEFTAPTYPWADAFVAFKIRAFRIFARYENVLGLLDRTRAYYQATYYPQPFPSFRFGVDWRFLDSNRTNNGPSTGEEQPAVRLGPTGRSQR